DGWGDAREKAGVDGPEQNTWTTEDELLGEIRRVAEVVDRVPSQSDMRAEGEYSDIVYRERFGSWTKAVRKAGFEPRERGAQPGDENPAWKDTTVRGYYGPNWDEQREKRIEIDDCQCQHCGMSRERHYDKWGEDLNVHHIKPRSDFVEGGELDWESANRVQNLITLCNTHHGVYEGTGLRPHNVPEEVA
ncbi:MAG: homing endonuclease associated repeat-containing protein, partial [Halobacteriaceae archaeon]